MSDHMTVGELRSLLDAYDDDTVVMIAHQPSWPLAETLANLVHATDCGWQPDEDDDGEVEDILWLVAGGHAHDRSPYAPRGVFDAAGVLS